MASSWWVTTHALWDNLVPVKKNDPLSRARPRREEETCRSIRSPDAYRKRIAGLRSRWGSAAGQGVVNELGQVVVAAPSLEILAAELLKPAERKTLGLCAAGKDCTDGQRVEVLQASFVGGR